MAGAKFEGECFFREEKGILDYTVVRQRIESWAQGKGSLFQIV